MFFPRVRSGPILFLVFTACSSMSEPSEPLPPALASLNVNDSVVIAASGSGTVDLSTALTPDAVFEFVASRASDGTVGGHFRQRRMRGALVVDFTGRVTCVTIDLAFPGRLRIGGVITKNNSTDPAFLTDNHDVGDDVWFRVQDGAVDASTTYGFKPTLVNTSEEYCALPFDGLPWWNPASIFPLKRGQISVSPS